MELDPKRSNLSAVRRVWAAVVTASIVWLTLVGLSPVAPTASAATTPCADDEVTVIVDGFGAGCAPAGGNGYETLLAAGFKVEVTQKFPDFVCRINGSPGADVDKCLTASPSNAYWAYWHAPLGASEWTYSNNGAFTRKPAAGTVDAWMWGAGKAPGPVPVSRSQAANGEQSQPPSYNTDAAAGQGDFDIPMVDTSEWDFSAPEANSEGAESGDAGDEEAPELEVNPDNPDELIEYRDAEGNAITREEYEVIVEEAEDSAGASADEGASGEVTRERSTVVRTAPGTKKDAQSNQAAAGTTGDDQLQLYTGQPAATADDTGGSSLWAIALSVAAIVLVGAAAAATWVIRRQEVSG